MSRMLVGVATQTKIFPRRSCKFYPPILSNSSMAYKITSSTLSTRVSALESESSTLCAMLVDKDSLISGSTTIVVATSS
nr:hypothetical protein CFP56_51968 [Quercus suber]